MKKITFLLSLCVLAVCILSHSAFIHTTRSINPILGDISFIQKFGYAPTETTDEDLRIKTHLEYTENLLMKKDVSGLSPELQQKRKHVLSLLHAYYTAGIFPRNYDYNNSRKPCFIDKENRICAVGYIVEQTAGRQVAEEINSRHKYDEVLAMNDDKVESWIESSGLSKEECAMIQPTYGPVAVPSYNYISPSYGISSSIMGGVNLSLTTLNAVQLSKGANNKTIAIAGLLTGAGQTILGAASFPKDADTFFGAGSNESRKTLSMINIGLGTSTMLLSTWNLITNRKPSVKKLTWNLNSFETPGNKTGMAFTLTRKL